MRHYATISLLAVFLLATERSLAQILPPAPNLLGDSAAELVVQKDKREQKKVMQKEKQKEKEKDKSKEKLPPPLALSDLLPQEQPDLSVQAFPQAPEMLGNFGPTGVLATIPPSFRMLPSTTVTTRTTINVGGKPVVITQIQTIPGRRVPIPGTGGTAFVPLGGGGFKIADNNSPMPQDRVYLDFNMFDDFLASTNNRLGTGVQNMSIYRESFGMEKTFLGGDASLGLILPLNTLFANSPAVNLNGTHTALGDLSLYARYAAYRDVANNNCISGGLALTVPSGPNNFAGISEISPAPHTTIFQPFGSFLWNFGDFYIQGFTSLYTPAEHSASPLLVFNDVGIGYFVYRAPVASRLVSAIAPTFEVHVTDPLNFRGQVTDSNPFGAFDIVDLGLGLNVLLGTSSRLAVGVVTPVTGPRPFNTEALVQFRVRF